MGILAAVSQMLLQIWLLSGGILTVVRLLFFEFDKMIVSLIGTTYRYFVALLEYKLFDETVINSVLKNIYLFIGIIVFFRLSILLVKYLVNPEMVSDKTQGAKQLIQRLIMGLIGILLIPWLFKQFHLFEVAIIRDNVIQKILVPSEERREVVDELSRNGGKYIGTFILSGFVTPISDASVQVKQNYNKAILWGDMGMIAINEGTSIGVGYGVAGYKYNYYFIVSTICLLFSFKIILQYAFDIITRFFKLFFYQLVSPIAFVEYIIKGKDDGVFKKWWTGVLGCYFSLFVRMISIWFILFTISYMIPEQDKEFGVCSTSVQRNIISEIKEILDTKDSKGNITDNNKDKLKAVFEDDNTKKCLIEMNNNYNFKQTIKEAGKILEIDARPSLLKTEDTLLRAIVIMTLLAFTKDLPKLLSDLFGLDFVQESSTSGLIKEIGGALKAAAGAAITFGGTAIGSMVGTSRGMIMGAANAGPGMKNKASGALQALRDANPKNWQNLMKTTVGQTPFLKNAYDGFSSGYGSSQDAIRGEAKKRKEAAEKAAEKEEERKFRRATIDALTGKNPNMNNTFGNQNNNSKRATDLMKKVKDNNLSRSDFMSSFSESEQEIAAQAWDMMAGKNQNTMQVGSVAELHHKLNNIANASKIKNGYIGVNVESLSSEEQEAIRKINDSGLGRVDLIETKNGEGRIITTVVALDDYAAVNLDAASKVTRMASDASLVSNLAARREIGKDTDLSSLGIDSSVSEMWNEYGGNSFNDIATFNHRVSAVRRSVGEVNYADNYYNVIRNIAGNNSLTESEIDVAITSADVSSMGLTLGEGNRIINISGTLGDSVSVDAREQLGKLVGEKFGISQHDVSETIEAVWGGESVTQDQYVGFTTYKAARPDEENAKRSLEYSLTYSDAGNNGNIVINQDTANLMATNHAYVENLNNVIKNELIPTGSSEPTYRVEQEKLDNIILKLITNLKTSGLKLDKRVFDAQIREEVGTKTTYDVNDINKIKNILLRNIKKS